MRIAVLVLLLCVPVGIARSTRHLVQFNPHADEGYYLRYASRVVEEGPAAFPRLFEEYIRDGAFRRIFPSPARILSISAGATAMRVWGIGFPALAGMSLASLLFLLAVMFWGVRRWFGDRVALWAGLLFAAAPLHLLLARRALTDTIFSAAILGCFWLVGWALGVGEGVGQVRPRRWWAVAAGFTAAFLIKESAVVLVPVSLALIGWRSAALRRFVGWWPAACVTVVPACAAAAAVAAAAGGFTTLREASVLALQSGSSSFAVLYMSGPWFRYVVDLLLVAPWPVLAFLGWLGVALTGQVREETALFWILVPVLFIVCTLVHPSRDVRLLMPVEMPIRLGAVLFLQRVFRGPGTPIQRMGMAGAVAGLLAADLLAFQRMARADLLEPATLFLLRADGFLPI